MKPEPESHPKREITHWPLRPFVILVAGFFAFLAIMFLVLGGLTARWTHGTWPPSQATAGAESTPGWNSTAPQLQPDPAADLSRYQKHEYDQLHATHWTDNSHTYAVIPVDRAIDLITEASVRHRLDQLLPTAKSATPLDLQNQKSMEAPKSP
jgi:hypothetical protein